MLTCCTKELSIIAHTVLGRIIRQNLPEKHIDMRQIHTVYETTMPLFVTLNSAIRVLRQVQGDVSYVEFVPLEEAAWRHQVGCWGPKPVV